MFAFGRTRLLRARSTIWRGLQTGAWAFRAGIEDAFKDERLAIAVQDGGVGTWEPISRARSYRHNAAESRISYKTPVSRPFDRSTMGALRAKYTYRLYIFEMDKKFTRLYRCLLLRRLPRDPPPSGIFSPSQ
jgi:hypothetical protein